MSLFDELKRRNVFRVAIGYVGVSWLVLQVIDVLFGIFDYETDIDETIVIVLAIGFIPAMILAWVFELTPDGIKRDDKTERDTPAMRDFGRRVDRIIIAILSVAVVFFAADKFWPRGAAHPSIAVMPFENVSGDPAQDSFASGMTTQLRTMLTSIRELRVLARNTVEFYASDGGPQAMREEHGLAHILEGSVQTSGNRVRVTATLVDLAQGTQVWSESFDREINDVFAIQDEIAASVVRQLNFGSSVPEAPIAREIDIAAYKLYLEGNHLLEYGRSDLDWQEAHALAIPVLEQAVDIEPEFVDAWLDLAKARYRLWEPEADVPDDTFLKLYDEAIGEAREISPDHPVVLAWDAGAAFGDGGDTQDIATKYERAIESAPTHADVIRPGRQFVMSIGRTDIALAMAELAIDRDPKCVDCWRTLAQILRDVGRYAESQDASEVAMALGAPLEFSIALTRLYQHDAAPMLDFIGPRLDDNAQAYWAYSLALYTAGRQSEFEQTFATLRERWGDVSPIRVAMVYAWSDDVDAAFAWLEKAIDPNPYPLQLDYRVPLFDNLRGDPRWNELLRRIGRHPEQLAKIEFDPDIPEVRR